MGSGSLIGYASRLVAGAAFGWVLGIITLKYPYLGFDEEKEAPKEDVENN